MAAVAAHRCVIIAAIVIVDTVVIAPTIARVSATVSDATLPEEALRSCPAQYRNSEEYP
jgi:hypothetical protein